MKSVFDNLAENLRTWGNIAVERAGEFTKVAAVKADELSKAGRLKMDIFQMERERGRLFTGLGRAVYEGKAAAGLSLDKIEKAAAIEQKIVKISKDIATAEAKAEAAAHLNDDVGAGAKKTAKGDGPSSPEASRSKTGPSKAKKSPASKKPVAKKNAPEKTATKPAAPKKKAVSKAKNKPQTTKKGAKKAD